MLSLKSVWKSSWFWLFIGMIMVTGVLFSNSVVFAQNSSPKIVFVLDVSGSMGDQVGGQEKLKIAKQTIYAFLPSLQQKGISLGLLDFSGCGSVQFSVPAGPNTYSRISTRVSGLQASGGTPLAAALQKAASNLRNQSGERRIFLLSDGKETCGGAPIQVARKISGWGIKIYVVGFDVGSSASGQLQKIAAAGGGSYSQANNAQQLQNSFKKLTDQIEEDVLEQMRSCVELGGGHKKKQKSSAGLQQRSGQSSGSPPPPQTGTSTASKSSCQSCPQNQGQPQKTKSGRIDGFEGLPWGASPSRCEQSLGTPHSKSARALAKQIKVDLPQKGQSVWLYKEKKYGANSTVWLGFGSGAGSSNGLIWTKRRWSKPPNGNKVANQAKEALKKEFDAPLSKNTWVDNSGKIVFYHDWGNIEVRYFSSSVP